MSITVEVHRAASRPPSPRLRPTQAGTALQESDRPVPGVTATKKGSVRLTV